MAIAITLREFNDLGRSVTVVSMGYFLHRYSTFCEKKKLKSIEQKFDFFAKRSIEFRSVDLFSCVSVSNASLSG